ncbi:ion channel [Jeongeupia chitinilytica]|uniref:Potassium channel domain-containing protein n=1 Tax=Jeongeupia chitinilytica TaxID=1041641 RepID=A0ABQ3H516_9NEIS|nr:ion channel [Jeongeupia chitinilytica]GHD67334.1 hypothetical protein GCM10007350_30860 [Jeongeupia chitinilytica]
MLRNLLVGGLVILLCMMLQSWISALSVNFYRRHAGRTPLFRGGFLIFGVMTLLLFGNFLQVSVWGGVFLLLGEFGSLYDAVYHSAVNFATLGYGDVVMSPRWKLLGPIEAINGAMMIALSGAVVLQVLQLQLKALADDED